MIQVKKRDGTIQDFDKTKIAVLLIKVGLSQAEADRIANEIESWSVSQISPIDSSLIKEKLLTMLSPDIAQKIREYVKPPSA